MTVKAKTKKCATCNEKKPYVCFYKNKNMQDGYLKHCKKCITGKKQSRYQADPEYREKLLMQNRKTRTGWDDALYQKTLKKQKGLCAICKKPCKSGRALAGDHCHKTLKTRGLLCGNCNRGISQFDDNVDLMKAAIRYLERFQ